MSRHPSGLALLSLLIALPAFGQNLTPGLPISATAPRVLEGNTGFTPMPFLLRLAATTTVPTPITVRYRTLDQSATAGSDYVATQGEVVFTATEREHTITVQVTGDTQIEPDEVLILELTGPNQQIVRVPGTIQNDDGNAITPGPNAIVPVGANVQEPGTGFVEARLPVRLMRPVAGEVRVSWVINGGSATPGSDYLAEASGTLRFPPGSVLAEIPVRILADNLPEPPERVRFEFSDPVGLPLARDHAELTILDRSAVSPVASGIAAVLCQPYITEGDSARVLLRRLGSVANAATVNYATADGSAIAPEDYLAATGSVSWPAGDASHRLITLQSFGDDETEPPEFFSLGFSGGTGAAWVGPPQLRIVIRDAEAMTVDGIESLCSGEEALAGFGLQ